MINNFQFDHLAVIQPFNYYSRINQSNSNYTNGHLKIMIKTIMYEYVEIEKRANNAISQFEDKSYRDEVYLKKMNDKNFFYRYQNMIFKRRK